MICSVADEMTTHRDLPTPSDNSLAAFVTCVLPESSKLAGADATAALCVVDESATGDTSTNHKQPANNHAFITANSNSHNLVSVLLASLTPGPVLR